MFGNGDFMIGGSVWPGLSKLIEECGEVLQVGGKLMGSAGDTSHWSGDLNKSLVEELGDLLAAIQFFIDQNDIDAEAVHARAFAKSDTFARWHRETKEQLVGRSALGGGDIARALNTEGRRP